MHLGGAAACLFALVLSSGVFVMVASPFASGVSSAQVCVENGTNPVLNATGPYRSTISGVSVFDYSTVLDEPSVIARGGGYTMWAGGSVNNVSGIFMATSTNGTSWTLDTSPVLGPGPPGSWDSYVVYGPSVVWNGTQYLMYFSANNGTMRSRSIGVAFSSNGVSWTEYSHNPIIKGGPGYYDAWWARFPSVVLDNGIYKMWYTGSYPNYGPHSLGLGIDYATSTDGVTWTKYAGNPVFVANGTADAYYTEHPSVVKISGTYIMAFDDNGERIAYATSADGIAWNVSNVPLVTLTSHWDDGVVLFPDVELNGSSILLWHYGAHYGVSNSTYEAPSIEGVGLAYCNFIPLHPTETTTLTETSRVTTTETSQVTETGGTTLTVTSQVTQTTASTTTQTKTLTVSTTEPSGAVTSESYIAAAAIVVCLVLIGVLATQRFRRPKTGA
jgi:predicted GH43/DUF377 family glycosyl hydrolase